MYSNHNTYHANCYYLGTADVPTIHILYHANCYYLGAAGVATIATIMQKVKISGLHA